MDKDALLYTCEQGSGADDYHKLCELEQSPLYLFIYFLNNRHFNIKTSFCSREKAWKSSKKQACICAYILMQLDA